MEALLNTILRMCAGALKEWYTPCCEVHADDSLRCFARSLFGSLNGAIMAR